jgi:large subunit ribosomal protein L29
MNAAEMRNLAAEELAGKVQAWEEELFRSRCNKVVGQQQQTHLITALRRTIARAKTLLNEKSRDAASQT